MVQNAGHLHPCNKQYPVYWTLKQSVSKLHEFFYKLLICVKQRHLNIYHVMPVKSHNVVGLLYAVWDNVQAQVNSEVPYCQFHWSYYFTDLNLPIKPSAPDLSHDRKPMYWFNSQPSHLG